MPRSRNWCATRDLHPEGSYVLSVDPLLFGLNQSRKIEIVVSSMITNKRFNEGGHKAGCQCGFCKNKGKFGKKDDDKDIDSGGTGGGGTENASKWDDAKKDKKPTAESIVKRMLDN